MPKQKITIVIEHVEKNVPLDLFVSTVSKTVGLLKEMDRKTEPERKPTVQWSIARVSMRSPLHLTLEAAPLEKEKRRITKNIVRPFIEDMNRLERGEKPEVFTPDMERRAKSIVSVLFGGVTSIKFESDDLSVSPTTHLAAYVDEDLKQYAPYYEIGSIEGRLEVLSVKSGESLYVKDMRFGTEVECDVSAIQLEEAKEFLGKRVSVRGQIRYSRKKPQAIIDVFDIRELRDSKRAPQPEDIGPVDLTGGIDPVDYLRGDYCKKKS